MDLDDCAVILRRAKAVAVLTGAGVSAESGVPTFRGEEGLWRKYRAEELATPGAFERDPVLVWEWYDWRRGLILKCEPNQAHLTLAEMEGHFKRFSLITQNVDGIHRRAGSRNVITVHGDIFTVRCTSCGKESEDTTHPLPEIPPRCGCGGLLRPAVVWFGEMLDPSDLQAAQEAANGCDVMLVVGTSAIVYPAAALPHMAKSNGAVVLEFNMEPTPVSDIADASFFGKAGEELPRFWQGVLERMGGRDGRD